MSGRIVSGHVLAAALARAAELRELQLLGHADVSTTANIYVQGSPADLEQKLDKVWGE